LVEKGKSGKMSKSSGEFLTVSLLENKGYDPVVYRMFCLQSHYRKPLEFSYEVLDNMTAAYEKLVKRIGTLRREGEVDQEKYDAYRGRFEQALCDDLNSSMAITVLYDMLKEDMSDATKYALAEDFDRVLSLNLTTAYAAKNDKQQVDAELESYILAKIEERKAAKKEKDFARADAIRAELQEKGILLEDTREGVKWKKA
jgi:cysteinyl-tRNA synthetase